MPLDKCSFKKNQHHVLSVHIQLQFQHVTDNICSIDLVEIYTINLFLPTSLLFCRLNEGSMEK